MIVAKIVLCCLAFASLIFGLLSAGLAWWLLKRTHDSEGRW